MVLLLLFIDSKFTWIFLVLCLISNLSERAKSEVRYFDDPATV